MERLKDMMESLHTGTEIRDENNGLKLPTNEEDRKVLGKRATCFTYTEQYTLGRMFEVDLIMLNSVVRQPPVLFILSSVYWAGCLK